MNWEKRDYGWVQKESNETDADVGDKRMVQLEEPTVTEYYPRRKIEDQIMMIKLEDTGTSPILF